MLNFGWAFFYYLFREQLNLPLRASEVIFDSEVHFVSEVSPKGEVANLTSLVRQYKLHCLQLHFCQRQKLHLFPIISEHLGQCNTEITSKSCVHIFKEYKAKMAESIEHDLL